MKNLAQLREMALSGDKYVSWAAIDNITDQNTLKEIAKAVFTEEELAWMKGDPLERFFRLWTWKE